MTSFEENQELDKSYLLKLKQKHESDSGVAMLNDTQRAILLGMSEEEYRQKGVPSFITLSDKPWSAVSPPKKEEIASVYDKDSATDANLKADYGKSTPSIAATMQRAVYRPELDYHLHNKKEQYVILTTYGPDEKYDVRSEKVGFTLWGVVNTLKHAANRILTVRKYNPHAIFYPMRVIENANVIFFPLDGDGDQLIDTSGRAMGVKSSHLDLVRKNCDFLTRKFSTAVEQNKIKEQAMRRLNEVTEFFKHRGSSDITIDSKVASIVAHDKLDYPVEEGDYVPEPLAITPSNLPLFSNLQVTPVIHPEAVSSYIRTIESAIVKRDDESITRYVKKRENGKTYVIQVVSVPKKINQC